MYEKLLLNNFTKFYHCLVLDIFGPIFFAINNHRYLFTDRLPVLQGTFKSCPFFTAFTIPKIGSLAKLMGRVSTSFIIGGPLRYLKDPIIDDLLKKYSR